MSCRLTGPGWGLRSPAAASKRPNSDRDDAWRQVRWWMSWWLRTYSSFREEIFVRPDAAEKIKQFLPKCRSILENCRRCNKKLNISKIHSAEDGLNWTCSFIISWQRRRSSHRVELQPDWCWQQTWCLRFKNSGLFFNINMRFTIIFK